MRILIIGMNYLPESASIGPYTAGVAEYLRARGHQVQVITSFPMAPQWRIWDGYRGEWYRRETIHDVPVLRTYVYVPREPRRAKNRILYDVSFSVSSLVGALFTGPCDLVLTISPPLQLGITGWIVKLIKHARLVFEIQDLVPDAAVSTGLLSETSNAVRIARRLESFVYGRSDLIRVICEGFKRNLLAKGVPQGKIRLLPDYIDLSFMQLHSQKGTFRLQHGIHSDDFLVVYSGSISLKQGLEVVIDAAALLQSVPKIKFAIIGEGPPLHELMARAEEYRLDNVIFLPFQSRESLPEQLAAADVLVITQRKTVKDIVFPGKLLYYMASGRPILAAVSSDSETGLFIEDHRVGIVTPPEDPQKMAKAILRLHEEGVGEMGNAGRRTVEQMFDSLVVLPALANELETLVQSR